MCRRLHRVCLFGLVKVVFLFFVNFLSRVLSDMNGGRKKNGKKKRKYRRCLRRRQSSWGLSPLLFDDIFFFPRKVFIQMKTSTHKSHKSHFLISHCARRFSTSSFSLEWWIFCGAERLPLIPHWKLFWDITAADRERSCWSYDTDEKYILNIEMWSVFDIKLSYFADDILF